MESESPAKSMENKFMLDNLDKCNNDTNKFTAIKSMNQSFNNMTNSVIASSLTKNNQSIPTEEKHKAESEDKGIEKVIFNVTWS